MSSQVIDRKIQGQLKPEGDQPEYLNRVMDTDSHEMVPLEHWAEIFDPKIAKTVIDAQMAIMLRTANGMSCPDLLADDTPINDQTVWEMKGPAAPSAIDMRRRPAVMDEMGVSRQLVFPTFGTAGLFLMYHPMAHEFMGFDPTKLDQKQLGRDIVTAYNNWVSRVSRDVGDRVRPCAIILPDQDVEGIVRDTKAALDSGVRAILLAAGLPPAGTSPADKALDPFWSLLEEANVPALIHIGTEFALLASPQWSANVKDFVSATHSSIEFPMEPYRASIMHYSADQYLSTLVLGGVFERHPRLRVGVLELMADWVGPLAERLDLIVDQFKTMRASLSLRPSEYIARNVRVSPFTFEPIEKYLERYPMLEDVLCYSSDFPHVEGGKHSKDIYMKKLAGFSDEVRRKFFVDNGEWLLPA